MLNYCSQCNGNTYTQQQGDYYKCDTCGILTKVSTEIPTGKAFPEAKDFDQGAIESDEIVSLALINAMVTADNASALTIRDLELAGVTGAEVASLADYITALEAATEDYTLATLQAMVDA